MPGLVSCLGDLIVTGIIILFSDHVKSEIWTNEGTDCFYLIASHISIGIWLLQVFGFVFLHMELVKSLCSVSSFSQSRVKLYCTTIPDSKQIHHVKMSF